MCRYSSCIVFVLFMKGMTAICVSDLIFSCEATLRAAHVCLSFFLYVFLSPFFGKIVCFKGALKLPQGLIKVDSRVS